MHHGLPFSDLSLTIRGCLHLLVGLSRWSQLSAVPLLFWWERLTLVGGVVLHSFSFTPTQRLVAFTCIFCTRSSSNITLHCIFFTRICFVFTFCFTRLITFFLSKQFQFIFIYLTLYITSIEIYLALGHMSSFVLGPGLFTIK